MHQLMKGVRVLEVAQFWFVPSAGAVLADWGANVIKVEHPERGDGQRGLASERHRHRDQRRGLPGPAAEPRQEEPRARLRQARGARAALPPREEERRLPHELPARRTRAAAIDVADIRQVNPKIIYVRGHGQGARGPEAHLGGYDASSFWSRGGICDALTPAGAAQPTMQRAAFGDGIGGMTIAGGIAAALFHRERTGEASVSTSPCSTPRCGCCRPTSSPRACCRPR